MVPSSMHLLEALEYSHQQLMDHLLDISEERSTYKYEENKWSIKKLVLHITDTDRVFQYRALSIARGSKENLPPFDENEFADNSFADELSFHAILNEYKNVANGFHLLYENMDPSTYYRIGVANHTKISAATIGFLAAGHRLHHLKILKERY